MGELPQPIYDPFQIHDRIMLLVEKHFGKDLHRLIAGGSNIKSQVRKPFQFDSASKFETRRRAARRTACYRRLLRHYFRTGFTLKGFQGRWWLPRRSSRGRTWDKKKMGLATSASPPSVERRSKHQCKRISALQVIFSDSWSEEGYHALSIKIRTAWAVKAKAMLCRLNMRAKQARWAQAAVMDEGGEWSIAGTERFDEHKNSTTSVANGWIPGDPLTAKQDAEWEASREVEEWRSTVMEKEERAWVTFYMMQDLDYDESIYPGGRCDPDYPDFLRRDEDYAFQMSTDWEIWEDDEEWELVEEVDEEENAEHWGIRVEDSRALMNKERRKMVGLLQVIRMREVRRRECSPRCEMEEGLEDMLSGEWIPGQVAMGRIEREWNSIRGMAEGDAGVEVSLGPADWGVGGEHGLVSDFEARPGNGHARRWIQG